MNSTISANNHAISQYGFPNNPPPYALIASSTIVSNMASGLTVDRGSVEARNSIVAGNGVTNNFAISAYQPAPALCPWATTSPTAPMC